MGFIQGVKDLLHQGKDAGTSFVIQQILDRHLSKYGHMLNLAIDSQKKSLSFEILLKGETAPMKVEVEKFEILQDKGANYIEVKQAKANKEWLSVLIQEFVIGRRFSITDKQANLLRLIF